MTAWIALLRAVNVGGRKYPMAELRAALENAGFEAPQTHIQTGNVLVRSPVRSRRTIEARLEKVFAEDRGFTVATICLSPRELREIADDVLELSQAHAPAYGHYVSVLRDVPTAAQIRAVEARSRDEERILVRGRAVHLLYDIPYGEAKTSNAAVEKLVGVSTNRNHRVIRALADKWGA